MVRIVGQRSGVEGKEKRGLLDELLGPTGVMVEPLSAKRFELSLQVGFSMFQHLAMLGVPAALKLINDVSERQAKALSFADSVSFFRCQSRLPGETLISGLFLLRFDGLAFPAPSHRMIVAFHNAFSKRR
jgi:hypothetical protein